MPDLLERLRTALADRYTVESELGRGGMAAVFLAEDLKHHRKVAVKVLHPELGATLAAERFLSEIKIAAGLNHPHILALFDSGEADDLLYYVMPYVEGESLRERLQREGELPVEEAVRIAVEAADGLQHAHERGVVHRDIKPGNILLSGRHAVIADFGIARAVTAAQEGRMTGTGLGVGTPLYASPEQATGAETLDGRTDVYSLGCVLYELLTGEVPLTAATPQAVQARRLVETPAPIHAQRETVPPLLDQVVAKALAKRPADRWESAEAFGQALMTATMDATPVARLELEHVLGGDVPAVPPGKWSPGRWALLAGAVAVVAAGAWLATRREAGETAGAGPGEAAAPAVGPVETELTLQGTFGKLLQFTTGSFAISPDGEQLAYCSREESDDTSTLWVADLSQPARSHRALWSGTTCSTVRWSLSGDRVLFSGGLGPPYYFSAVSERGGPVEPFTECAAANEDYVFSPWLVQSSPDGAFRAFANQQRKDLRVVPTGSCAFGSGDSILVRGDYEVLFLVAWAPSVDLLLVSTKNAASTSTNLRLVSRDGRFQKTVASDGGLWPYWWSPDGGSLYYTRNGAGLFGGSPDVTRGTIQVMRLDLSSSGEPEGEAVPVPWFRDHPVDWFSISVDGQRAVVAREVNRYRIVRLAPDPRSRTGAPIVEEVTDPIAGEAWWPMVGPQGLGSPADGIDITRDGRWLLLPREVPGGSDLYKVAIDGREVVRLTRSGQVYGGVWSPDGRFVAYLAPERDSVRLWLSSSDGRSKGRIPNVRPATEVLPVWGQGRLLFLGPNFQLATFDDPEIEYGQEASAGWQPVEAREGEVPTSTFVVRGREWPLLPEAHISGWRSGWKEAPDSLLVEGFMLSRPHISPDGSKVVFKWRRDTGPDPIGTWWWIVSRTERMSRPLAARAPDERPVGWTRDGTSLYWRVDRDIYLWPLGGERRKLLTLPEGRIGCIPRPDTDAPEFFCLEDLSYVELFLVENFDSGGA